MQRHSSRTHDALPVYMFSSIKNLPFLKYNHLSMFLIDHCGSPSAVAKLDNQRFLLNCISISFSRAKKEIFCIVRPLRIKGSLFISSSSLQLPTRMEFFFSTRQDHSIAIVNTPVGFSRLLFSISLPSSIKRALP